MASEIQALEATLRSKKEAVAMELKSLLAEARTLEDAGEFDNSLHVYSKALELSNSENVDALMGAARCQIGRGDTERANLLLSKACYIDRSNTDGIQLLVIIAGFTNDWSHVLQHSWWFMNENPENMVAKVIVTFAGLKTGDFSLVGNMINVLKKEDLPPGVLDQLTYYTDNYGEIQNLTFPIPLLDNL